MSDISDFLGIGTGEGEISPKSIFDMATGQWLVNALIGKGGTQAEESREARYLESGGAGNRGWRADQPGGGTVAAPAGGVSQPTGGGGGDVFSQLLGALTDKDSEGPTSFSVTPSKVGGYSYKIDGQAPQGGLPKEESKMGTSEDFMKMFGG
jgi:hypothetical protein